MMKHVGVGVLVIAGLLRGRIYRRTKGKAARTRAPNKAYGTGVVGRNPLGRGQLRGRGAANFRRTTRETEGPSGRSAGDTRWASPSGSRPLSSDPNRRAVVFVAQSRGSTCR